VGPGGRVAASEVDPALAARARANLADYPNVTVFAGDGAEMGAVSIDDGTFDVMFINAGVTHPHPPWLKRLNDGGRIVLPLTMARGNTNTGVGLMLKITRTGHGFAAQIASDVAVYSCTSVRDPAIEPLIPNVLKILSTGTPLKLKSVRLDQHEQTDTCILHTKDVCLSAEDSAD
jgi:protein-L-isoaspartate(D-aspartate) O-methyltransferase